MGSPEKDKGRAVRESAYLGSDYTYHAFRENDMAQTSWWYFLTGVKELSTAELSCKGKANSDVVDADDIEALEARARDLRKAADRVKRLNELRASLGDVGGVLVGLLDRVVRNGSLPTSAKVFTVQASNDCDDFTLGAPDWTKGLAGAIKKRNRLLVDISLNPGLTQSDDILRQAINFVAAAVAVKCIPYDRSHKHRLHSVVVTPADNMEMPFEAFDYVLERLQGDQRAELAALTSARVASAGSLRALRAVHESELAVLRSSSPA